MFKAQSAVASEDLEDMLQCIKMSLCLQKSSLLNNLLSHSCDDVSLHHSSFHAMTGTLFVACPAAG